MSNLNNIMRSKNQQSDSKTQTTSENSNFNKFWMFSKNKEHA